MMLVDDYLRAVAAMLPKAGRDDIVAELRDMILTRIEAREAELNRSLTEDEVEAVLRDIGHPLVVAARYRQGPQHVVGPTLYPFWLFAVKTALAIELAVVLLVFVIRTLTGGDIAQAFGRAVESGVSGAVMLIGLATIAAWLVERGQLRVEYLDRWRVRDLRIFEVAAWDAETLRERLNPSQVGAAWPVRPRRARPSGALGAIAAGTVFVLWWVGVLRFGIVGSMDEVRELGVEPGALAQIDWPALRAVLFWPVLALGLSAILLGAVRLAWPRALPLHGLLNVVVGGAVIALAGWFWTVSPLAPAIQVHSLTEFALRVKSAFPHGGPVVLDPLLTLAVAMLAFSGLCQVLRGLGEILIATVTGGRADPPARGDGVASQLG
jgi:hypothetical protein